jgi:hypothetical protein
MVRRVTVILVLLVTAAALGAGPAAAEKKPLPPLVFEKGEPQVPLTPATKRELGRVLNRFVPAAVLRRDPGAAWDLATPGLRAGDSRADWQHGAMPVVPYEARGPRWDKWYLRYSYSDEIDMQIILMPSQREERGPIAVEVNFRKVKGHWRIDGFMPEATFARAGESARMFSVRDVSPDSGASGTVARHDKPRLGSVWFVVPGLLLLLPFAAGLAWAVRELRWNRRARRASAEGALPDLSAFGRR